MSQHVVESRNDESVNDQFLVEEGLDLLAAFKSIRDAAKRRELMALVIAAAQDQNDKD